MTEQANTVTIPVPIVRPLGVPISASGGREVWDAFVKPDQDTGNPQSVEMRCLMAILRAVYQGMTEASDDHA